MKATHENSAFVVKAEGHSKYMHVDVSAYTQAWYCVWCSCDVASERRPYFVSSSSLVLDHKWWKMERKKGQCYNSKYGTEFDFITKSGKSKQHAFCTICRRDISIAHGGRSDIVLHTKSKLHIGNFESESSSTPKITSWMSTSQDLNVTRAECLIIQMYWYNVSDIVNAHISLSYSSSDSWKIFGNNFLKPKLHPKNNRKKKGLNAPK